MSTDQTLASDTDSSLETSAGPLGCCRWLAACLRNPVFFRRWRAQPQPEKGIKKSVKSKKNKKWKIKEQIYEKNNTSL